MATKETIPPEPRRPIPGALGGSGGGETAREWLARRKAEAKAHRQEALDAMRRRAEANRASGRGTGAI